MTQEEIQASQPVDIEALKEKWLKKILAAKKAAKKNKPKYDPVKAKAAAEKRKAKEAAEKELLGADVLAALKAEAAAALAEEVDA